MEARLYEM